MLLFWHIRRFKGSIPVILFVFISIFSSCRRSPETIHIIHAGSLSVPVKEAADSFMRDNPGIKVLTEAWGSKAGARRISEMDVPCDVYISADYNVIDIFLIPGHASWNISFAGNEMAVVFNQGSRYSDEIDSNNWYEILLRDDVIYGRSDPHSDPCGVRAVFTAKLAEIFYDEPAFSERLLSRHHKMIRPKETDLLALLEKNALDYIFLYRSVAEQHDLNFIELPVQLNLRDPELNKWYGQALLEVPGTSPGETILEKGEAMVYGITVPHKAINHKLSLEFVKYFLSPGGGLDILERNGQNVLVPYSSSTYKNIPEELRFFALPGE